MMQVVQGHVSDAEGQPVPGATVLAPGTLLVTTTNATGDYTLSVPAGTALKFGYADFADEVLRRRSASHQQQRHQQHTQRGTDPGG
ncbi:carboxypeptidase regulatory-like domain-containing protein [Hymenobacter sp. UYCo722]|uniref:carboxypeptidase-like regulatory domain-containing protein n=1 Tax=Hymenobacter sp. UYCo722 TaxID=3156335 RepID=UPI003396E763